MRALARLSRVPRVQIRDTCYFTRPTTPISLLYPYSIPPPPPTPPPYLHPDPYPHPDPHPNPNPHPYPALSQALEWDASRDVWSVDTE